MSNLSHRFDYPKKSLGQHFLVNKGVLRKIVESADIKSGDTVVEIGPGTGLLTELILARCENVVLIELDVDLVDDLKVKFREYSNIRVIHADARSWVPDLERRSYKLLGNLPYYAANPIMRNFLESERPPSRMYLTLQKEVADSIVAAKGKMRILSVAVQAYGRPRILGQIRPGSFFPPPKVMSSIVEIDVFDEPVFNLGETDSFFGIVRAGFGSRRKQLKNSLARYSGLNGQDLELVFNEAKIPSTTRAQDLDIDDWVRLHEIIKHK